MTAALPASDVRSHDELLALPARIPLGDGLVLEAAPHAGARGWLLGWRADALMIDHDPGGTLARARRLLSARYPNGGSATILPEETDR